TVSWADGLVRMASEAADALDPTLARTGQRGDRNLVVLHVDVDPDGTHGPAQLELGAVVPDHVARYMCCDARVQVMTYLQGRLTGVNPAERTVNRATRRYLARRDQGCTFPLCGQKLWLHAHHIQFWEHGGVTEPKNLTMLCPHHHRALHAGEFSIDGDPEAGTLRVLDRWGQPIAARDPRPPDDPPGDGPGPPGAPPGRPPGDKPPKPPAQPPFTPPLAERLDSDAFRWN
ncbi:MAG TPA: HNH endonuclease signature motif containing protein, partial [Acidimicrobiales bacterium]|nr:HNH endonuclease signature motif containing protein [Acidimicrobiales bacterium]